MQKRHCAEVLREELTRVGLGADRLPTRAGPQHNADENQTKGGKMLDSSIGLRREPLGNLTRVRQVIVLLCGLIAISLLVPVVANAAGEISDFDIATYALTRADGQPTGMQMRLTKANGKWRMEGKEGNAPWKNISCDAGCDYRASSSSEAERYLASFPAGMHNRFDIACIQNTANAFCRLTNKENPSKGSYALVALVTERPVPLSLQRLTRPYPSGIPLQSASPQNGSLAR